MSAPVFPAVINAEFLCTLTPWRCERVNSLQKQSQGLFLLSWPWSWTSALFTCRLQTKMVLTEGRKFAVGGRAGNSKPKESWRLQRSDLSLVTLRVTVLVQCGKMSDSSRLSSSSFSVYAAWVSRLLHRPELRTLVFASKLAGKTSLDPEELRSSHTPSSQPITYDPGLTLTSDLTVNNRALRRWRRELQHCFYLRWCQNEHGNRWFPM